MVTTLHFHLINFETGIHYILIQAVPIGSIYTRPLQWLAQAITTGYCSGSFVLL